MTVDEETASAARELSWLLSTLDETIGALRSGLQECLHLLAPSGPGSTLPLSTSRSEALKGFITRVGSRVTRGDMQVKMAGLPYTRGLQVYKLSVAADHTLMLEQLVDVGNYVVASLEVLRNGEEDGEEEEGADGDGGWLRKMDPKSVMQMLCALHANMKAARTALKGASAHRLFPFHAVDPKVFDPPLPANVAFDLYITEAAIIAELRTLESLVSPDPNKSAFFDISPFGFRERFAAAVGIHRDTAPGGHGGADAASDQVLRYNDTDVRVRELVRVESQDPTLMAAWAKLGGLEHVLGTTIKSLKLVMTAAGI